MIYKRDKWFEVIEMGTNYALVRVCDLTEVTAVQAFTYDDCREWLTFRGLTDSFDYDIERTGGIETEHNTFLAYNHQGVIAEVKARITEHGKNGKPVRHDLGTVSANNFKRARYDLSLDGLKVVSKGWQHIIPPDNQSVKPYQMLALYRLVVSHTARHAGQALGIKLTVNGLNRLDAVQLKEIYTKFMKLGGLKLQNIKAVEHVYDHNNMETEITRVGIDALTIDMHYYGTFNGPAQREEAKKLLKKWLTSKVVK